MICPPNFKSYDQRDNSTGSHIGVVFSNGRLLGSLLLPPCVVIDLAAARGS